MATESLVNLHHCAGKLSVADCVLELFTFLLFKEGISDRGGIGYHAVLRIHLSRRFYNNG